MMMDCLLCVRYPNELQEGDDAQAPDLLSTFVRAKTREREDVPDLLGAFRRATSDDATQEQGDGSDTGLEKANAPTGGCQAPGRRS
jgi:hypothetical protein